MAAAKIRRASARGKRGAPAQGELRNYLALLGLLHRHLKPRTYVEIGVASGRSLVRALPETFCVGVDPEPKLRRAVPESAIIFELTSDEFFRTHDLRGVLGDRPVDLAFIDGMHLFEFALRDFIQLERTSSADGVIAIHDCYPPDADVAARERKAGFWTGDVWKLILCLKQYRPDLNVAVVDVPPSGLGIVTKLDPNSTLLQDAYDSIVREFSDQDYDQLEPSKAEALNVVGPVWRLVEASLPGRRDPDSPSPIAAPRRPQSAQAGGKRVSRVAITRGTKLLLGLDSLATDTLLYDFPEDWLQRLQDRARSLEVRFDAPSIQRLENVTYFPKFDALYDESGQRILETCVRRGPGLSEIHGRPPATVRIPPDAPRVTRPVVYCGKLRGHWGHFLTEGIARLWAISDDLIPSDAGLLYHKPKHLSVSFVEKFFRYTRIRRDRFVQLKTATTLAEVILPHPTFSLKGQAFSRHLELPERVAMQICSADEGRSDQPLYLSRRRIDDRQPTRAVNEEKLEQMLTARGVRIVSPETLSYEDQVRLFNRHSTFIGRIGSAFHTILYSVRGTPIRTVSLGQAAVGSYSNHFMIDHLKGINAAYLFDEGEFMESSGEASLDARALVARLKHLSLI
jgi:capsular polysaccharide biosynthesis protein